MMRRIALLAASAALALSSLPVLGVAAAQAAPPQTYWVFKQVQSGTGKALSIAGGSTAENAKTVIQTQVNATDQLWIPIWNEQLGGYILKNRRSGLCLDVPGASTADGVQLQQHTCNGTTAQAFWINDADGRNVNVINVGNGKCLDLRGGGTADQTPVQQFTCNVAHPNMMWVIEKAFR